MSPSLALHVACTYDPSGVMGAIRRQQPEEEAVKIKGCVRFAKWVLSSVERTMLASWLATVFVVLAVVWRLSGVIVGQS